MEIIDTENPREATERFLRLVQNPYQRNFDVDITMSMASAAALLYIGNSVTKTNEVLERLAQVIEDKNNPLRDENAHLFAELVTLKEHIRWIPIWERLPESGADVWIVEKHGNKQTAAQYYDGLFGCGEYSLDQDAVVCWTYQVPFASPKGEK